MDSEFSRARKIHPKRSLCGEMKYTFKVRITELYFEAIEISCDPEKLSNDSELECGSFLLYFFQNTFGFLFSLSHMQS